jgi:hypothetical protein
VSSIKQLSLILFLGLLSVSIEASTLTFNYAADIAKPIAGIKITQTESDGTITILTTDADGQVIIANPSTNTYTLNASLTETGSDPLDILDAIYILQHSGELRTLDAEQLKAADVSGDGNVDLLDAIYILQHSGELRTLSPNLIFLDANTGNSLSETIFGPGKTPTINVIRTGDVDQGFDPSSIVSSNVTNNSCSVFRSQLSSINEFNYCWEEDDQSTSGTDYSANVNEPINVIFTDETIIIPAIVYAESLYIEYGIILSDEGDKNWDNDSAYAIYQTIKAIPLREVRDQNTDFREFSKWTLTDELLTDDVSISIGSDDTRVVNISSVVFNNANPKIAVIEGKRGIYFSNRLHHALVRFVTNNGNDSTKVNKILTERYGVSINIPDYQSLTGETATRFQEFHPSELVEIINLFEEMPKGMHKIDGLDYLVRRLDGTCNPSKGCDIPAVAWDTLGYIEFMEVAFNTVSVDYIHRLILHEKTHFLWAKVFNSTLKDDWVELGGWYECSERVSGWCTTKQTEFVSAYAHLGNPNEDMAESISFFMINPDALRSRSLLKYEFIRDRIMQGNIYISVIQENLTFEVYNIYPDYVFPGKVKRLMVSVTGEPNVDKTVTVEIQLHTLDKDLEGANWARMRIYSTANTYFDLYLNPVNGEALDSNLRGVTQLSKYAKKGLWQTDQLVISDQVGNLRMEMANDFGWRMYVNNPQEDLVKPEYTANSATLELATKTVEGVDIDAIHAKWQMIEDHPKENQGCYGALNDEEIVTYSYTKYSPKQYTGDYQANNCFLEYLMPSYMPSGKYRLNFIRMFDDAGNESRNWFKTPAGVDQGTWPNPLDDRSIDEDAPEVTLTTTNPDTKPPELDLNNISITAEPTNPSNPNGETNVAFTFRVKDDISGYKIGWFNLRDPQGLTQHYYHYPPRSYGVFPSDEDLDWLEYTANVILPVGSAPGTWGVVELSLRDRANNFKTYDFTEIVQFNVD